VSVSTAKIDALKYNRYSWISIPAVIISIMILVIDNYDSFTYNLVQYVLEVGSDDNLHIFRNDEITIEKIKDLNPNKIIISPGPGIPENAGISIPVIRNFSRNIPVLGVCLGHQVIAASFGGNIITAPEIVHGKTSIMIHKDSVLFKDIPRRFMATRYHSLIVEPGSLPNEIRITAENDNGLIMALEHRSHPLFGVQFHPESIATEYGKTLIRNFLHVD
jgi:anthranilate synthase/aminodeoxychorismate synthase-like glutamine amidotransferase